MEYYLKFFKASDEERRMPNTIPVCYSCQYPLEKTGKTKDHLNGAVTREYKCNKCGKTRDLYVDYGDYNYLGYVFTEG